MKKLKDPEILDSAIQAKFGQYKQRDLNRGLQLEIPYARFKEMVLSPCTYCGAKAEEGGKAYYANEWYYYCNTLDRKDSKKGYTLENSVPCCFICNMKKQDWTVLQWLKWVHEVAEHTKDWPGLKEEKLERGKAVGRIKLHMAQENYVKDLAYGRRGEYY